MKELGWDVLKRFVLFVCSGITGTLIAWVKKVRNENQKLKEGMQALLREKFIDAYEKYMYKGYCPIYARDSLEKAYHAYHELGGNGTVTHLWEELQELPTEKKE